MGSRCLVRLFYLFLLYLPVPTLSPSRPPRDSRRWRQAAQRHRPSDDSENRRFLWLLAATVALVLGVVGSLLVQSLNNAGLTDRPSAFEQRP